MPKDRNVPKRSVQEAGAHCRRMPARNNTSRHCKGVTPSRSLWGNHSPTPRVAIRACSSPCAVPRRAARLSRDARSLRVFNENYPLSRSFSLRVVGVLYPHTPLRGCYTLALPYYLFVACASTRVVKELRRKISRAQPANIFAPLTTTKKL